MAVKIACPTPGGQRVPKWPRNSWSIWPVPSRTAGEPSESPTDADYTPLIQAIQVVGSFQCRYTSLWPRPEQTSCDDPGFSARGERGIADPLGLEPSSLGRASRLALTIFSAPKAF
jgi:hypothetical protein